MSNAWEGYNEGRVRRGSRGRKKRFRRLAVAVVLVTIAALVGLSRCLPQSAVGVRRTFGPGGDGPAALALVVYNENDPLSRDLAAFYADKRGIPAERVVSLKCPLEEEISREQYDQTIAGPLRALFDERHWWNRTADQPGTEPSSVVTANRIRFLVLMRGIPLRIRQTSNYPGDFSKLNPPIRDANGACVDSELAALGFFTRSISGILPNPYFRSFSPITETNFPGMMLTGRLDAPTGSTVRQMITDSLAVEQTGLWGRCYLDGRGFAPESGPLAEGDEWIRRIDHDRAPYFLPTIFDQRPETFSAAYPMTEAAMYFGWYTQGRGGAVHEGGVSLRAGSGRLPHPFLQRDERARPAALVGWPATRKGRGGGAWKRLRAVPDADDAPGHLCRSALRRLHPGGKRVGGDAGAVLDEYRRG